MVADHHQFAGIPIYTRAARELPRPATDQERAHFLRYTRPDRWPIFDRFPVSRSVQERSLRTWWRGTSSGCEIACTA